MGLKGQLLKIYTIEYDCIGCNIHCATTNHNLKYRQHHQNEHYCQKCLIKLDKQSAVFTALPPQFHQLVFGGLIDHDLAITYLKDVGSNIEITFRCDGCSKPQTIRWNKLRARKYGRYDKICGRCLQVKINNSTEFLDANKKRSKALWQQPGYRKRCLLAFELHNQRMQYDTEYAARHRRRSRSIDGKIQLFGNWVRFDSGFELVFLDFICDRCRTLRRCRFAIPYGGHFYHPDFFVILPDGRRQIIEIKGYYNNNVLRKQTAAIEYLKETNIADDYVLYTTQKLLDDNILIGTGGGRLWDQIRKINDARIIRFTNPQHQEIAKIGRSRYYKNTQNKSNNKRTV